VHCFGPLVYRKGNDRFDHVARHALRGEVSVLTLAQLRGAELEPPPVVRALVIENQTPFLDRVDALAARGGAPRELVICARGQAGWAVIELLRRLARAGVPIVHAGDLDRSGVLILRSLARRARARITPLAMDAATHRRFHAAARPISPGERERLGALLAVDDPAAAGHDLLAELAATGRWIEQEAFFDEVLAEHEIGDTSRV